MDCAHWQIHDSMRAFCLVLASVHPDTCAKGGFTDHCNRCHAWSMRVSMCDETRVSIR